MPQTDPNTDFAQFVKEVVAEEMAAKTPQNTQLQPTPEPLTLTIAGQSYSYANKAELEAAMNNFTGAVSNKIGEYEQQLKAQQVAPNPQGAYVTGTEPVHEGFSNDTFIKTMTEDPRKGLSYWLNHEIFEGKSENPAEDIKRALTETELTKRSIAAYQFKENHPEFPGGQQAAQIIDQVRASLNLPYDYNGIEAAYLVAMQRGALPNFFAQHQAKQYEAQQSQFQAAGQPSNQNPFAAPQMQQQVQRPQGQLDPRQFNGGFGLINPNAQSQAYAQNPYLNQAPPGVGRNAPNTYNSQIDPENLSLEQIEAIFEKSGNPIQRSR